MVANALDVERSLSIAALDNERGTIVCFSATSVKRDKIEPWSITASSMNLKIDSK